MPEDYRQQHAVGDIQAFREMLARDAKVEVDAAVASGLYAFAGMESNYGSARASSSGNHLGYLHMGQEAFADGLSSMAPVIQASGGDAGVLASAQMAGREDDNANLLSGLGYMTHNAKRLAAAGKSEFTLTDLYIMHNLGPASGEKVAAASDDTSMGSLGIPESHLQGNARLYLDGGAPKSVGAAKDYIHNWIASKGADPNMKFRLDENGKLVAADPESAAKGEETWAMLEKGVDPQIMASARETSGGFFTPPPEGSAQRDKYNELQSMFANFANQPEMLFMMLLAALLMGEEGMQAMASMMGGGGMMGQGGTARGGGDGGGGHLGQETARSLAGASELPSQGEVRSILASGDDRGAVAAKMAEAFVGVKEVGNNGGAIVELCGGRQGDPWCASFINYVFDSAMPGVYNPENTAGAKAVGEYAGRYGAFRSAGSGYTPQVGDAIVFDRGSDPTKGHVGIVTSVENGKVTYVSGNDGDAVRQREFSLNAAPGDLVGYADTNALARAKGIDIGPSRSGGGEPLVASSGMTVEEASLADVAVQAGLPRAATTLTR